MMNPMAETYEMNEDQWLFYLKSTLKLKKHEIHRVRANSWYHLRNTLKVMYSTQILMTE